MSAGQTLRVLVNARLTAAAEEIFALFERTTAEFEEELRRSREENQRKQELLDSVLSPRVALLKADLRTTESPRPGLDQGLDQDLYQGLDQGLDQGLNRGLDLEIKEELREELLQVSVPESSAVYVKEEESTVFHQTEPLLHPQTEGGSSDNYGNWSAPFSWSGALMQTGADGDPHDQISTNSEPTFMQNRYQCSICKKTFKYKSYLQIHKRIHSDEKPFSCPICTKTFISTSNLRKHMRVHTGEKPFSCPICTRQFSDGSDLKRHLRVHTGEKPFSCSICNKTFSRGHHRSAHMSTHTKEEPHS
ncbi:uncharacterized protein [Eucyclogobius newberryi]|uniref:uncharacterized protein n=1 Tax=Eucyclogobius newberryi TaxID=166745 RepID=UPI003B59AF84